MDHIITELNDCNFIDKYFPNQKVLFFDIETTGFSRKYNHIYLIGLLYYSFEKKTWIIHQAFIDSFNKEKQLVEFFNNLTEGFDTVISFNGDAFDLPFIESKLASHGITSKLNKNSSYDIYRLIRQYKFVLPLENLKLKTLEEFLGIYRQDKYSGKDCIDFYYSFLKTKENNLKKKILLHNLEDLYYLKDILSIIDYINEKTLFYISNNKFQINKIDILKGNIKVQVRNFNKVNFQVYDEVLTLKPLNNDNLLLNIKVKEGILDPYIDDIYKFIFINKKIFLLSKNDKVIIENILFLTKVIFKKFI